MNTFDLVKVTSTDIPWKVCRVQCTLAGTMGIGNSLCSVTGSPFATLPLFLTLLTAPALFMHWCAAVCRNLQATLSMLGCSEALSSEYLSTTLSRHDKQAISDLSEAGRTVFTACKTATPSAAVIVGQAQPQAITQTHTHIYIIYMDTLSQTHKWKQFHTTKGLRKCVRECRGVTGLCRYRWVIFSVLCQYWCSV